jgi:hypothetical protein
MFSVLHEMRYGDDAVGKFLQFNLFVLRILQGLRFGTLFGNSKIQILFLWAILSLKRKDVYDFLRLI